MMPAAEFIKSGGLRLFQKDHALRFFLLVGMLEDAADSEGGDLARRSTAFARVASLKASVLVEHGSSFFWYHVDRLYDSVEKGQGLPTTAVTLLLAHLFDSFHAVLDDGDFVSLSGPSRSGHIVFPCLGLRLPSEAESLTLQKVDNGRVRTSMGQTVELRSPGDCALPFSRLTESARLLFDVDELIVDTMAKRELADLSPRERRIFRDMLRESLEMVRIADEELWQRIGKLIRWYFPITTPDKRNIHNSFTISALSGAVFLSEAYGLLPLLEAMVHEYYHNELWIAMRVEPHLRDSGDEYLYSPWRRDARPLTGLYHGSYVFTGLMDFFEAATKAPDLSEHHQHFEALRRKSYYQVRTALAQFPVVDLEPRGKEFFDRMAEITRRHGSSLGATSAGVPEPQLRHWERWSQDYPEFRRNAIAPTAVEEVGAA